MHTGKGLRDGQRESERHRRKKNRLKENLKERSTVEGQRESERQEQRYLEQTRVTYEKRLRKGGGVGQKEFEVHKDQARGALGQGIEGLGKASKRVKE